VDDVFYDALYKVGDVLVVERVKNLPALFVRANEPQLAHAA
jgi:hypothetical protein